MAPRDELIDVLLLTRAALAHPDNDFVWSSWEDITAALAELDGYIATLKAGAAVPRLDLDILFAATGDVGEVALSSGWGDAYLRLAERFDAAHLRFQQCCLDVQSGRIAPAQASRRPWWKLGSR
jgi:hypothetical protein